jgi:acetyl-CoA carboxylase carboxyl transferase subunit beta
MTQWFGGKASRKAARKSADALPDGLWTKCPKCNEILFNKELEKNLRVCNKCGYHYRLGALERINMTVDDGTFIEMDSDLLPSDPLEFPEYASKVNRDTAKTGLSDAIVTGTADIGGIKVVIGVADFAFMGGSMGGVVGEKVVRAMEAAIDAKLPVVMFTASGGARMQEGLLSLMQMPKTCAAAARLNKAGLPYIVVFTDPTMAGVLASYASVGDFIFSEPGALVGFAGQRVGQQAQVVRQPENFQRAEFQLEHGMIDRIVPRREVRSILTKVLQFCGFDKEENDAA